MKKMTKQTGTKDASNPLYVVVHGLFAFVTHVGYLDLVTPALDEHVFAAGTFGQEKLLEAGQEYVLGGVAGSSAGSSVESSTRINLSTGRSGVSAIDPNQRRYCWIRTPIPDAILTLRSMSQDSGYPTFVGRAVKQNALSPKSVPMVTALQFNNTESLVTFGGPDFWHSNGTPPFRLHIWAEEPFVSSMVNHASHAFNVVTAMFSGLDLGINPMIESAKWTPNPIPVSSLIPLNELATLQERVAAVPDPTVPPKKGEPGYHLLSVNVSNCFSTDVCCDSGGDYGN